MTYKTELEELHNKEAEEKEQTHQSYIDEFIDLYIEIKKLYARYKALKKNIIEEKGEGIYVSQTTKFDDNIYIQKFKTSFSAILKEEFNKLDNKQKRELFKSGLLKINFRLDTKKYQELKDKNTRTDIDSFVNKRKNDLRFFVKLSPETKKELSKLEKKEETELHYEKFAIEAKIEEMIEAIENPDYGVGELNFDDFYFDDDDE
jgi:hypothetical protein